MSNLVRNPEDRVSRKSALMHLLVWQKQTLTDDQREPAVMFTNQRKRVFYSVLVGVACITLVFVVSKVPGYNQMGIIEGELYRYAVLTLLQYFFFIFFFFLFFFCK